MSQNKVKFGLKNVHIAPIGVSQTIKIKVTDPPSTDGEIGLTVTADTLLGVDSPAGVVVPLASETHTNVSKVASAIVNILNDDDIISGTFRAWHDAGNVYLATKVAQANDTTLDVTFADTGTTGATMGTAQDVVDGTTGYGVPRKVPGAVNLSMDPEGDKTEFYADDTRYFIYTTNNGYSGDLEMANIPDDILVEILGMMKDNDGMLVESTEDDYKAFALLFEVSGDEKNRRMVFYRCEPSRPGQEASTREASVDPQTDSMPIDMLPTEDENRYVKGALELSDTNQAAYNSFFDAVKMPNVS